MVASFNKNLPIQSCLQRMTKKKNNGKDNFHTFSHIIVNYLEIGNRFSEIEFRHKRTILLPQELL